MVIVAFSVRFGTRGNTYFSSPFGEQKCRFCLKLPFHGELVLEVQNYVVFSRVAQDDQKKIRP